VEGSADTEHHFRVLVAEGGERAGPVSAAVEDLAGGAIAAAVEIEARMPGTKLVVTHGPGEEGLVAALAAGASAYVARSSAQKALVDAIVDVARGEVVLSRVQAARVVQELRDPTRHDRDAGWSGCPS